MIKSGKSKLLLLVPAIILCFLWTLIPFYSLVVISLTPRGSLSSIFPRALTLAHYKTIMFSTLESIFPPIINSFVVACGATVMILCISLPCGYGLSRWKTRVSKLIYLGSFVLRMIPPITFAIPWFFILLKLRLMDTRPGVMIALTQLNLPVGIWLMKGFFDTLPEELEEASWVDGATVWQGFRRVVLPLSLNGVIVVTIFSFIMNYIHYMYGLVLTRREVLTLPVYIAGFATEQRLNYQEMLAAAFVGLLPMILVVIFAYKHIIKGVTVGSFR